MSGQFKFKPDKIKYLSNIETLNSDHKKTIENLNKKRDDMPHKKIQLDKLKERLINLDNDIVKGSSGYINLRASIIRDIEILENELEQVDNYQEETNYYAKTYQILFNYYDMLDGQMINELKSNQSIQSNQITNLESISNSELKPIDILQTDSKSELIKELSSSSIINSRNEEMQLGEIFKSSKLDMLNEISKKKRKEKKTTRKRVKNVESLIKDNTYDIFEFINVNDDNKTCDNCELKTDSYDIYDRAKLYNDYKMILEGQTIRKKTIKLCINCGGEKTSFVSDGIYLCLKCGEVENCIIENEPTNNKELTVEKPTFPYKRKNHFCEWIDDELLLKVMKKNHNYSQ